ncbi:glycosyltransferase [Nitrosospira multiformis]|uniref:glycosyltransferase n=1 Tax=Nitrosospira multiformis TaxID=1231 RepID=UPI00089BEE74|nr:glycosyltransferase [Nitrosospira multiformis]SEA68127.1 Glycosyltransferase involved in cell wall bisynthesis [Nitrosospira multiformis]
MHSARENSIVLTMIVRNEAHVLQRCLRSVRSLIDAYCIVDTGSRDGTPALVGELLADIPGRVHEVAWVDFAHNRTEALVFARAWGDYSLMIDADVECICVAGDLQTFKQSLTADVYDVELHDGDVVYSRPLLTSTRTVFRYRGVLHEFLEIPESASYGGMVKDFLYRSHFDGARSQAPEKFSHDAEILARAFAAERDPLLSARYCFYLAQSYRDAGQHERALRAYAQRTQLGGWHEERFYAWLMCGRLREALGHDYSTIIDDYLRAWDTCPTRAESLYSAARLSRAVGRLPSAYLFSRTGLGIDQPVAALFLEQSVYNWKLLAELALSAYSVNAYTEGRCACDVLLREPVVPDGIRLVLQDLWEGVYG